MKVARLEVFGFKSFMERLVLPLESGFTGVVGPNGCGKSNVVDALRWVLGETRASQLRGGTLEDVIFNGTDSLRPLGLAEVTITLRADGAAILDDIISPRAEAELVASGEVFDEVVRPQLRVIQGGVSDSERLEVGPMTNEEHGAADDRCDEVSGAGEREIESGEEEGANEPGEGQSDQEIGSSVARRRSVSLISRFQWLSSVSEVQVTRRLYRSGESEFFINKVACRLKDLKDFFRAIGLGARAYTIVAQGEVGRIVTAKPTDRRQILEEAAGVVGFRDKIAEATRRLTDTSQNILRLQDVIGELDRQVAVLKRQAARARARQEIKEELTAGERTLFLDSFGALQEREDEIVRAHELGREAEQVVGKHFAEIAAAEGAARGEIEEIEVRIDEVRGRLERLREESRRRERTLTERRAKQEELRKLIQSTSNEILRLRERIDVLQERRKKSATQIEELQRQDQELGDQALDGDDGGAGDIDNLAGEIETAREGLVTLESSLREVRDAFIAKESSLAAMREQIVAAAPSHQLSSVFGAELAAQSADAIRLLVDEMHIPERLAKAAQAVIAERARYLLVSDPWLVARKFSARLRTAPDEVAGVLGVFRAGFEPRPIRWVGNREVPFPALITLLSVSQAAEGIVSELLRDVVVADSLEAALDFFQNNQANDTTLDYTVVTLDGEIVTKQSFVSSRGSSGLIELRGRELSLSNETSNLANEQDKLLNERISQLKHISALEVRHAECLRIARERQRILRELGLQQGNIRGLLQAERSICEQIGQDFSRAQEQVEELQSHLDDLRYEAATVEEDVEALEVLVADSDDSDGEELVGELAIAERSRRERREHLQSLSEELLTVRSELDRTRAANARFELEAQKIMVERQSLSERFIADQGSEAFHELAASDVAVNRLEVEEKNLLQQRVTQLRNRLVREGEVDPGSIEQYECERERLSGFIQQRDDLERAAATLRESVQRLTATSEERFLATFHAVRKNFGRLVPSLFGGGAADLSLSDPSRPLDSGVEIAVRPPGKKLKSIDLMSGGEKALCATALIFAMFLERPSPLCVLDEVDAPLDEANLQRFLKVIREMSVSTQFLMITHNKASMAAADTLVGVTMPTPGASKMITVSLQEAVAHGD
jgi:chromosome segregation protein